MLEPKVSICCVTYNHELYIRECLDGFLMQKTDFEYEILIHDDASIDNTADIIRDYIKKYPNKFKAILQTENQYSKGISPSITYNFPRAQGKYIAMCEGDDYWTDPLKLQKQVDFLEKNDDYVLTSHLREIVDIDGHILEDKISNPDYYTQCLVFRNVIQQDFLSNKFKITSGDTFLISYLHNFGKKIILDFVGAHYRYSGTGVYSSLTARERYLKAKTSYENMLNFFKAHNYIKSIKEINGYVLDNEIKYILNSNKHPLKKSLNLAMLSIKELNMLPLKTSLHLISNGIRNIIK